MKTFSFRKTEHHSVMKFYDAALDEDEILEILRENLDNEDTVQRYMVALEDDSHEDHEAAVGIITQSEEIEDRWDWADEDDWWTERKGGYDVAYEFSSVDQATEDNTELKAAPWPFPNASPPESNNGSLESISSTPQNQEMIMNCDESGEYKIQIYSRGIDAGIGAITKEQYDYWKDQDEEILHDALLDNIEWESSECPENARFSGYYNDYYLIGAHGADADYSHVVITSPSGKKIYDGEIDRLYDVINSANGTDNYDCREFGGSVEVDTMEPGHYIMWQDGGKGCYFEGTIKAEHFDLSLLCFNITEFEGMDVIESVIYHGEEVENWGGDWTGKWNSITLHEV